MARYVPKPLKNYTSEELKSILDKCETVDQGALACVCSEVLRRLFNKEIVIDMINGENKNG